MEAGSSLFFTFSNIIKKVNSQSTTNRTRAFAHQ